MTCKLFWDGYGEAYLPLLQEHFATANPTFRMHSWQTFCGARGRCSRRRRRNEKKRKVELTFPLSSHSHPFTVSDVTPALGVDENDGVYRCTRLLGLADVAPSGLGLGDPKGARRSRFSFSITTGALHMFSSLGSRLQLVRTRCSKLNATPAGGLTHLPFPFSLVVCRHPTWSFPK